MARRPVMAGQHCAGTWEVRRNGEKMIGSQKFIGIRGEVTGE